MRDGDYVIGKCVGSESTNAKADLSKEYVFVVSLKNKAIGPTLTKIRVTQGQNSWVLLSPGEMDNHGDHFRVSSDLDSTKLAKGQLEVVSLARVYTYMISDAPVKPGEEMQWHGHFYAFLPGKDSVVLPDGRTVQVSRGERHVVRGCLMQNQAWRSIMMTDHGASGHGHGH